VVLIEDALGSPDTRRRDFGSTVDRWLGVDGEENCRGEN